MRQSFKAAAVVASILTCSTLNAGWQDMLKSATDALQNNQLPISGETKNIASSLTDGQIDQGLKEALRIGAERAVALLSKQGGFLNDASVRIPMPGMVEKIGSTMRMFGQGQYVDEFETTLNRAAEAAIPETLDIVKDTVTNMNLEDVRGILNGGDDAATQFLQSKAGSRLKQAIMPQVTKATDKAGVTMAYKRIADYGAKSPLGGFIDKESLNVDDYVADKTLDGLFKKLAIEEKKIRENPVARSTDLLKTVFGR